MRPTSPTERRPGMNELRSVARFTVLAAARTGSNLLCGLLNSHPEILCHHGLFHEGAIHYAIDCREASLNFGTHPERDKDPAAFLDRVWRNNLGMRAVGFKLHRDQHEAAMRLVTQDPGIRKILLYRRNRIKTYVSVLIAEQTGLWESYGKADDSPLQARVYVDQASLWNYVATIGNFYAQTERALSGSGQDFHVIEYESLTSQTELASLLRFLDVSPRELTLTAPSFKRNPEDLSAMIVNFSELAAALRGSTLEQDLHGGDLPPISQVRMTDGTTAWDNASHEAIGCNQERGQA
jgi:LPS sulfotransferase NodH